MNYHSTQTQNFTALEDLRAFHNERFIRLAYRSILGREVDSEGLNYYLSQLRQNLSSVKFLNELCNSSEAQSLWQVSEHQPTEIIDSKPVIVETPSLQTIGLCSLFSLLSIRLKNRAKSKTPLEEFGRILAKG